MAFLKHLLTGHSRRERKAEGARWMRRSRKTCRLRVSLPQTYFRRALTHFHVTTIEMTQEKKKSEKEDSPFEQGAREEQKKRKSQDNPEARIQRGLKLSLIGSRIYEDRQATTEFLKRLCQICRILIVAYRQVMMTWRWCRWWR